MPQSFAYKARNLSGRLVTGKVEAENQGAAVARLRERNYFVMEIRPARSAAIDLSKLFPIKIKSKDLAVFCRQFATMSAAGIPLMQCLSILVLQTEGKDLKNILREVVGEVEKGRSLSEAFLDHRAKVPEIFINMLLAGEVSGTIDDALGRLAIHFEKENELREKIKSAMTYPVMVAGMSVVAIIALLLLVVPIFQEIFADVGATLPLPTLILIAMSSFMQKFWWTLPIVTVLLIISYRKMSENPRGRMKLDQFFLKMPIAGPLLHKQIVARVASTLSTLLKSGVPLLKSLETVERVAGNMVAAAEIAAARENIKEGDRMAPVLLASKVFPPMAVNMIAVGEESGALDELLDKLAVFYEREVATAVEKLSSVLEPLMIAGVGMIIAFMALSIYMPLFGLAGAMGGAAGY